MQESEDDAADALMRLSQYPSHSVDAWADKRDELRNKVLAGVMIQISEQFDTTHDLRKTWNLFKVRVLVKVVVNIVDEPCSPTTTKKWLAHTIMNTLAVFRLRCLPPSVTTISMSILQHAAA